MPTEKRDVLVHYDEEHQKIVLYSVDSTKTELIREKEFDGLCPEVSYFKGLAPQEAEKKLGGMVFALVDLAAGQKIGIREYEAEAETAHSEFIEQLEKEVEANAPDAQYQLSIFLHSRAMRSLSLADLERAEFLLFAAAAQGHVEANSGLENWPLLKDVATRRINRGRVA